LILIALYKIVWGFVEVFSGLVIKASPALLASELTEDPQDLAANWIIAHLHPSQASANALGATILVLGLAKIVVALALWYRVKAIRPAGLAFFGAIAAFGMWHLTISVTPVAIAALVGDLFILWYFWTILPRHLSMRRLYE
jgi:uncharacterized membrane protein